MRSAYGQTVRRIFSKHAARLITVIAIVLVSVGVVSGIGEVDEKIKEGLNDYYVAQNVSDLLVLSSPPNSIFPPMGFFSQDGYDQVEALKDEYGEENVETFWLFETKTDKNEVVRLYSFDFENARINRLKLLKGRFPKSDNEILSERGTSVMKEVRIGSSVILPLPDGSEKEYTVVGTVLSPMLLGEIEEMSMFYSKEELDLSHVYYLPEIPSMPDMSGIIDPDVLTKENAAYITLSDRMLFGAFSKEYKARIEEDKEKIGDLLLGSCTVLSLYENFGIYSMNEYASKVGEISIIFMLFFLLVTMLVVYSTMTRLLDEERAQIACMKTLGYDSFVIVLKYLLFVLVAAVAGGIVAFPVGYGLTRLLYFAFNLQYAMPPFPVAPRFIYYGISAGVVAVFALLTTLFAGLNVARKKPVVLLARKVPKAGKRILLERISAVWNRLSFKIKSALRNVFLFKSRFLMTVISISGSSVLVLSGLGLMDVALSLSNSAVIFGIALVLIIFSAVLCALVLYNLTNINVSERNREIATLMVLGYTDREVTSYIFREMYIMCAIGALLGLPLGAIFIKYVFFVIDLGVLADVNWWSWLLAPAVTMLFGFISTRLLSRKITRTDMNASLKSVE